MTQTPLPAQGTADVTVGLLNEAADELAWLHRVYLSSSPLSEGVPRITRLLQKIEAHTGHVTESPYLTPNNAAYNHGLGCHTRVVCPKCGGTMRGGVAVEQTYTGVPDFPGDTHAVTMSPGGPGRLMQCLKCSQCGFSVTA